MENPSALLRRAHISRGGRKEPNVQTARPMEENRHTPAHISHHANYTALMRSHDRVRTRHIGVKAQQPVAYNLPKGGMNHDAK